VIIPLTSFKFIFIVIAMKIKKSKNQRFGMLLRQLYCEELMTLKEIARHPSMKSFKLSQGTVFYYLRAFGIPLRGAGIKPVRDELRKRQN